MSRAIRVALLTNIPSPYRLPFFRLLAARCDLRVIFDCRTEPNRQWAVPDDLGFPHCYMGGFLVPVERKRADGGPNDVRYLQFRLGVIPRLRHFKPDVVISIEFGARSVQAAAYCAAAGVPLILWSEGTPHSEGWQGRFRQRIRGMLVRRARAFWSNGVEASELLLRYGANRDALCEGMIGVGTSQLAREVTELSPQRERIRAELGVVGTTFLFSGQLVARKGIKELLAALERLAGRAYEFTLLLLGEGELRPLIEAWSRAHPEFRVVLLGFLQPDKIARIYAAADVFVMPTLDDNWSLVALEAAVAGLPQVFSRYNGATTDLLAMHAVGRSVDPLDVDSFARALRDFLGTPERVAREVTERLVDYYSPEACTERALRSIRAVLSENPQKAEGHTLTGM